MARCRRAGGSRGPDRGSARYANPVPLLFTGQPVSLHREREYHLLPAGDSEAGEWRVVNDRSAFAGERKKKNQFSPPKEDPGIMNPAPEPVSASASKAGVFAGGPDSDLTGKTLGDFHVLRRLGQGGMGHVYLAEQLSLKRQVALKILKAELADSATSLQRFKAEAEAVARATHAN